MSNKNKTAPTEVDVITFINQLNITEEKKNDSLKLINILSEITELNPKMWGPTIIGFGSYHYKYETGHEGDSPFLGFSPRKSAISLYIHSQTPKTADLLKRFGKYKIAKACIYINKLSDIDITIFKELCRETILYIQEHNECSCRIKLS